MGKQRKFGVFVRVALALAIAGFGLALTAGAAGAAEEQVTSVTPVINHACPGTGSNLVTAWGYTNSSTGNVVITGPDNNDDPRATFGDGDDDDNFFVPAPDSRGQVTTFLPGAHDSVTTNEPAPTTWVTGTHYLTSTGPLNCADLVVTKTQAVDTVTAGSLEQYTVTVKNNGPTAAVNVVLKDTLPAGAGGISVTPNTCTASAGVVTCPTIASLANGASFSMTISTTLSTTGSVTDTGSVTTDTYDPIGANPLPGDHSASVTTTVAAAGGPSGGGVLSQGQQLKFADTAVNGTVKVTKGTLALTADVGPCPTNIPTINCKSEGLNMDPHGIPSGQIVTEVFDSGRPSPFVPIWKVKFFYYKSDNIDHPMPLCPHYLVPDPGPSGNVCEYFRYMDLRGHAIVLLAVGANDARSHR